MVTQTGQHHTKLDEADMRTLFRLTDQGHVPRLRFDSIDGCEMAMSRRDGDRWQQVLIYTVNDTFYPATAHVTADGALFLLSRGRDTSALVRLDIQTGAKEALFNTADRGCGGQPRLSNFRCWMPSFNQNTTLGSGNWASVVGRAVLAIRKTPTIW